MKTISLILLITTIFALNPLENDPETEMSQEMEDNTMEGQLLGGSFMMPSNTNYLQNGQNLHNQINNHVQSQLQNNLQNHGQNHHQNTNIGLNIQKTHIMSHTNGYQNINSYDQNGQNLQTNHHGYVNQQGFSQNRGVIRKNVFNVPAGLHFHPSQIFCLAGQGFQNILENNCMIRVIYFVEITSQYNNNDERKFIIVYSLKNNTELFLAVEVCLKSGRLQIKRSLFLSDLSVIKKNFQINYFDPQIYSYYQNLKQTILDNPKFQNIITAYGWGNQHSQNWNPLRIQNIHDTLHPVKALKLAFIKMPEIARKIRRIMVLNVSNHNNVYVYLFRLDTRDRKKYYMGIKLQREQTGMELVTLIIDRHRKECEGVLKIKILNRDFMNFYRKITNEFINMRKHNQFTLTSNVNNHNNGNVMNMSQGSYGMMNRQRHMNGHGRVHGMGGHVIAPTVDNYGVNSNLPFLLGSAAPGEDGDAVSEEVEEEVDDNFGDLSDEFEED